MFITFEGIEGSGKGTMLERSIEWIDKRGYTSFLTREPGGSELGLALRAMLLDVKNKNLSPEAELFLYLADRAQHVSSVIRPALSRYDVVISDRYADSTIVYQGYARGMDPLQLFELNNLAVKGLWPDLTLVLDLEVETGLQRARTRNHELGIANSEGRFEAESMAFHEKVRKGYKEWANKHMERIHIIDASGSQDEVFARIEPFLQRCFTGSIE